jgi:uncharacterized protein (TIGR03084 family)
MTTAFAALLTDLRDEHDALDRIVGGLALAAWERPTPCEGWRVRDQIAHLAFFDEAATRAIVDPGGFHDEVTTAVASMPAYEAAYIARGRSLAPEHLLAWWRQARRRLVEALHGTDARARLPWYGVTMSAVSFATARLMETWSHGQDVADALAITPTPTDRLRHVAFLGARTRAYAYGVRGVTPRMEPVRLELVLPSGARWRDGDERADNRVTGSAVDFCLVVTQRRHVDDTDLHVEGPAAEEWMRIAQAFAGPPGAGRRPGQFRTR